MIPIRLARKIELGPRQMTFGFDDSNILDLNFVYSCIKTQYQAQGPVALHSVIESPPFVSEPPAPSDPPKADILQAVFWLAEALKIHLYTAGQPVSPFQAKQALIRNPDGTIEIVINQPVDKNRFYRATALAQTFLPSLPKDSDQYTLSRALANAFESWHLRLTSYQSHAEQPGLPGKLLINNSLLLIGRLLEKKDSHSIIEAVVKYESRIPQLVANVTALSDFYIHKLSFWINFAQQMQDFQQNMGMIRNDEQIHSTYLKLNGILNAPSPFGQVKTAEQLLPELKSFHQKIEQTKRERLRKECLEQTDKMIRKLSTLLDTFDAEDDYRNDILHGLRALDKKIGVSLDTNEIKTLFNDARDQFVDIIETL